MKELDYCPFKGAKGASIAIDGRIIVKFDCAYCLKNKTKKGKNENSSI